MHAHQPNSGYNLLFSKTSWCDPDSDEVIYRYLVAKSWQAQGKNFLTALYFDEVFWYFLLAYSLATSRIPGKSQLRYQIRMWTVLYVTIHSDIQHRSSIRPHPILHRYICISFNSYRKHNNKKLKNITVQTASLLSIVVLFQGQFFRMEIWMMLPADSEQQVY